MTETALQKEDGSLKLDELAAQCAEGDCETSVQHILLHHSKTRDDGTNYMFYGHATRDIVKMYELVNASNS